MAYTTEGIRNLALVGHAGSGKTTLAESLLLDAGVINEVGVVEKGSTVTDFDELEQKHHHSLTAAVASYDYRDTHINLIDTPGYPDFIGPTLSVFGAVETIAIVVNAQSGVESSTRRMMEAVKQRNLCAMIVVNRIDAEDVDLEAVYAQIQESFGSECLAVNLPTSNGSDVVDCFFGTEGESDISSVEDAHTAIVDQTVELDDDLMTAYLDQGEIAPEQLHDPFEQAMRERHVVPVCFVSSKTGTGVRALNEFICKMLPSPLEGNAPRFVNGSGDEGESYDVAPDASKPVLGHVFKISFDPFVGRQAVFRLYQGTIKKDAQVFLKDSRKGLKVGNLSSCLGKKLSDSAAAIPGDIMLISKAEGFAYDAVVRGAHDDNDIQLEAAALPTPMVGVSIAPKSRGDEQKIAEVLKKLTESDPCFRIERNPAANETILRGMGDLHLRMAVERMSDQYAVEVETAVPTIPYRETIGKSAEGHAKHKKQTGGAGQFGEVYLRIEPLGRGQGFDFVNKIVGGVIPAQFIPAIEKGVQSVLEGGAVAGFPMQDIRVSVYDGKYHAVDSKEVAFVAAGRKAFLEAVSKAGPVVLEPIVDLEVTVPADNMGDITGDLSSRRGRVSSTDSMPGGMISIIGQVPLAEMDDYQSRLKSMTGGEGSYTLEFSAYDPAPGDVQKKLSGAFHHAEED
jgi:elongation factor G